MLLFFLRKWEQLICSGYCASLRENLSMLPVRFPNEIFISQKKRAMQDKVAYLNGNQDIKKVFLYDFAKSNEWFANSYEGVKIDSESRNYLESIRYFDDCKSRQENAKVLYDGIKKSADISFLFDIKDMDCPLFVPLIAKDGKRDIIRKKLIENNIYCPVHWPRPNAKCDSNLYDIEISLVCDQRYDIYDIEKIIDIINN